MPSQLGDTLHGSMSLLHIILVWSWVCYQPESAVSCWFKDGFGLGRKRLRRIGIVAVARKLLIALWRFLETGEFPEGAVLTEA
jgi:transposase